MARANMARFFRQMGLIAEAEEQEDIARKWIVEVYNRPPHTADQIRVCVSDDAGTGDHILDHPNVVEVFNEGWHELGDFTKIAPNGKDAIVLSKNLETLGGVNVSELPSACSVIYPALGISFTDRPE